jgi:hypothetical protein
MSRPLSLSGSRSGSSRRTAALGGILVALVAGTTVLSATGSDSTAGASGPGSGSVEVALTSANVRLDTPARTKAAKDTYTSVGRKADRKADRTGSVLLPTGQRVWVTGSGPSARVAIKRAAGDSGQPILTLHRAGGTYVVPASAMPYLGHGLDRELFNVTRRATTGTVAGRLPVRMIYRKTRPAMTGLTVTATSKGSARGYVTTSSAAAFGRSVRARFHADERRSGTPALFADGATLSPATAAAKSVAAKSVAAKKKTAKVAVTVKAIGPDGRPLSTADAYLIDANDAFNEDVPDLEFTDGVAKAQVVPGDYTVQSLDTRTVPGKPDQIIQARIMVLPDLKVSGKSVSTTLDFRKATIQPRAITPKSAQQLNYGFSYWRFTSSGVYSTMNLSTDEAGELLLAPIAKARLGVQRVGHAWQLAAPGNSRTAAYTYDLGAMSEDLRASTTYPFTDADLATVKASYYGDGSSPTGSFLRFVTAGGYRMPESGILHDVPTDFSRTEYVGFHSLREEGLATWTELYRSSDNPEDPNWLSGMSESVYRAGRTTTSSWGRGPLVAGIPHQSSEEGGLCFMCRGKSQMNVLLAPYLDSADHLGYLKPPNDDIPNTRFQLYLGSKKLDDIDQVGFLGDLEVVGDVVRVGSKKGTFKAVFDVDRRMQDPRLATKTRTVLKFSSAKDAGPRPPADWGCVASSFNCRVMPVLTARLKLATGPEGSLPAGRSTVTVNAGRIQYAAASALKSVKLQVRFPGKDWSTVKLTATKAGQYTGTLDNTKFAGHTADLLLQATDKGGSSFQQTTLRAYVVARD